MNESKTNIGYILFLSIVAALGGFLFGYDTAVISGTIAQVSQQFGLTTLQEGWYVGCALVGSIGGVACAGVLSDKAGRKNTMILSAILFSASAIGCALSASFNELVVYRIIGGIGIHYFSAIYIRSIDCPVSWTIGIAISISYHCRLFRCIPGQLPIDVGGRIRRPVRLSMDR